MEIRVQSCKDRDFLQVATRIKKQGGTPFVFTDNTDYYMRGGSERLRGLFENYLDIMLTRVYDVENNNVVISIQDDCLPCDMFIEACRGIVKSMPRRCIVMGMCMNTTDRALKRWEDLGKPVVMPWELITAQNLFIPIEVVAEFENWTGGELPRDKKGYVHGEDKALQEFAIKNKISVFAIMPSLVAHEGVDSVLGHNWKYKGRNRGAIKFIRDFNFSGVNWKEEFGRYGKDK